MQVHHTDDAARAEGEAGSFLHDDPVAHNVLLTVLAERQATPTPGDYWWVHDTGEVIGFAMQSPRAYTVALAPAADDVTTALADAIHRTSQRVPGAVGRVDVAARFAGRWTDLTRLGARPREGQRLYLLDAAPATEAIEVQPATEAHLDLIVDWLTAFSAETGLEPPDQPGDAAIAMITSAGLLLSIVDDRPVAMTRATPPVAGVSRIGWVYTPPIERGRGHATRLVSHISGRVLDGEADRCVLYSQLSNPTSNAIYQRIGYRPVAEILAYTFT